MTETLRVVVVEDVEMIRLAFDSFFKSKFKGIEYTTTSCSDSLSYRKTLEGISEDKGDVVLVVDNDLEKLRIGYQVTTDWLKSFPQDRNAAVIMFGGDDKVVYNPLENFLGMPNIRIIENYKRYNELLETLENISLVTVNNRISLEALPCDIPDHKQI